MKPAPFEYHRPCSVDEAVDLLSVLPNAKVLAGGQSLMPMLNMRFVVPDNVIDLNAIDSLAYIRDLGECIAVGSMTRQRDLELSPLIRERLPLLSEALRYTGHTQTRNRGTLGGSLCHLDPAAEQPVVALAYGAEVVAVGPRGTRTIPVAEFVVSYMMTSLEPDEVVTEIRFPVPSPRHGFAFIEFARRHGDFAMASVAVLLTQGAGRAIEGCAITVGGVGPVPLRVGKAEAEVIGKPPADAHFARAAEVCGQLEAVADVHAPASYRQQLARVLTERALRGAANRM